ncbi:MAG: prolyl oligopeptidase family serine peptidase, partial [Actinomycetota bacterium]
PARRGDVVDLHHGREIADPYRWLEDLESDETAEFVAAQNAITGPYLAGLAERAGLIERMTELWDIPRTEPPRVRGEGAGRVMVWSHNDGLADQPTYWVQRGPEGDPAEPQVLLDPNTLSDDGAVAVVGSALSDDGRLFAYLIAEAGSDRQQLAVRRTDTCEDLTDRLDHLRFTSIAWLGDGFFYVRWPEVEPGSTAPVMDPSVHYHRIGTDQDDDPVVFHNHDDPEPIYMAGLTEDLRYLVLSEVLGTDRRNGLLYLDLAEHGETITSGGTVDPAAWVRLVDRGIASHDVVLHVADDGGSRFVVQTDRDAPNGRIVGIDLASPEPGSWITVVAETEHALEWSAALAGELLVNHLVEASTRLTRYEIDGTELGALALPGLGTITGLAGRFAEPTFFLGYQSFVEPPTVLRAEAGSTTVWAGSEPPIDPAKLIVERMHAVSSDGARVGMFVIRRAGGALPGPVELYGYGGFTINLTPTYSPSRLAFLEAGGIVAVANLRGGSEQGEPWHEQGALGNKQQVFDDLIACGEHLIAEGIATAETLGIRGGSNGGLLTAAVMLQRPDLFGAVISQVPVIDMLRFQHFTAGRFWTVEYGDAADADAFEWLIEYSPLHNVEPGVGYPPLLIMTAESDDRVVPMHAHKFAAEVQHQAGGSSEQPLLERVETRAGHGMGKPTAKVIEEAADIYAFLLEHLRP